MRGDILARGGKSATFPSSSHVPQSAWDAAFPPDKPAEKPVKAGKKKKK